MTNKSLGLDPALYDYLLAVSLREPDILRRLREETARHPRSQMQIAPEQGQFMALLVELLGVKKALEVGVFTGYSVLAVALALPPDGMLVACDVSEEYTAIARRYWQEAGVLERIELRLAPALETLYEHYYERSLQLVRSGGLIVVDNVLWSGRVAEPNPEAPSTRTIQAFNAKLHADERISLSLVPIADGLTLARKR